MGRASYTFCKVLLLMLGGGVGGCARTIQYQVSAGAQSNFFLAISPLAALIARPRFTPCTQGSRAARGISSANITVRRLPRRRSLTAAATEQNPLPVSWKVSWRKTGTICDRDRMLTMKRIITGVLTLQLSDSSAPELRHKIPNLRRNTEISPP